MQLNKPIELFDNQIVEISRQMCYIFFFATAGSNLQQLEAKPDLVSTKVQNKPLWWQGGGSA